MRPAPVARTLLVVVCATLAGCSSNNKGKIEGTKWSCYDQILGGKRLTDGEMTLEFKTDGGLVMVVGLDTHTGTFSLGSGDKVTFQFDKPLDGNKKHIETIQLVGNDLHMTDRSGTIRFKKVAGPPPKGG
jgi:hypothetical protein